MFETLALTLLFQTAGATPPFAAVQPPPAPYQGEWNVEVIDGIKVLPESTVTLRIERRTIAGLSSCNTYRGGFTADGNTVEVGELLRTMKTCDSARMSEEDDFLRLLRAVVRYEVQPDGTLILTTPDGRTISARRAAPQR